MPWSSSAAVACTWPKMRASNRRYSARCIQTSRGGNKSNVRLIPTTGSRQTSRAESACCPHSPMNVRPKPGPQAGSANRKQSSSREGFRGFLHGVDFTRTSSRCALHALLPPKAENDHLLHGEEVALHTSDRRDNDSKSPGSLPPSRRRQTIARRCHGG